MAYAVVSCQIKTLSKSDSTATEIAIHGESVVVTVLWRIE